MVIVILGSDRALAKRALEKELTSIGATELGIDRMDAASTSFDAMLAAVTAVPFFGSQRVVVLNGFLAQSSGKAGKGGDTPAKGELARLAASIPGTTTLVLFDPDLGELPAAVRKELPAEVSIFVNEAPRGQSMVELAQRIATEQGSKLDGSTARSILDRLFPGYWPQAPKNRAFDKPPSVELLESEIAKLALAAYPDSITPEIVEDLIPRRSEERTFPLLDAVISGNQKAALHETDSALRAGEEAGRTLAQVYQQIELAVGATAAGHPPDPAQTGRALGIGSAYRITKVAEAAQRSRTSPARQLRLALENDRKVKTGKLRNPEDALVDFVARMAATRENR